MRPLLNPTIKEISVEGILYALSDPVRVEIYMNIAGASCPQACSTFLNVRGRKLPKSTLSQHFKILREAGLIRSERRGVEVLSTTRCEELKERFGPLIREIVDAYRRQQQKSRTGKR